MFDKLRLEASRSIRVRDHMDAHQDELEILRDPTTGKFSISDHGYVNPQICFEGSKPQCEAFIRGMIYGAKAATAEFAAAF